MDGHDLSSSANHQHRARIVVLWRGNPDARHISAPHQARLAPVIDALATAGFAAEGVPWFDDEAARIEKQLSGAGGVLVWINPLADGRDRSIVDATLRRLAASGTWVSTHPDVTARMGTKEVLYTTRHLGWGTDTDLYRDETAFAARFWARLDDGATRVLKPLRGNDGQGVMKCRKDGVDILVQHAGNDRIDRLSRADLASHARSMLGLAPMIDQAFNDNAAAGMVRCYLSQDRVVGFAEQQPRRSDASAFGMNSAKTMHNRDVAAFADLRQAMETDWVPAMQDILGPGSAQLPALWDADFFYRPPSETPGRSRFVLCEINVSCVSPFPDDAPAAIAATARRCLTL